jgi:tetratricopeptide (TPR) repeat protein
VAIWPDSLRFIRVSSRFQRLELDELKTTAPPRSAAAAGPPPPVPAVDEMHDAPHWMRIAHQHRCHGRFEEALRHYSRAVETDRTLVNGWAGQVRMLVALGEFPEAELWARKALELFRGHGDLTAARAQALCRIGDMEQAQAASDAALQQPGQSIYPWLARGDLMLARKDPVEEHCFGKAAELNGDWLTRVEIAEIYFYYRRHAKALARCQQAISKTIDQPYAWLLQGRCEMAMGLTEGGRRSLKQCLDLEPRNKEALAALESSPPAGGWLRRLLGRGA